MNVTKGLSTWVGYLAALAAAIAPVIGQLADATAPLGVPPVVWVVVSAILAAITTIGRQWQAASALKGSAVAAPAPANVEIDAIPVDAHEGAGA